jgi:type VI secretion system secreted protein VgrG
MATSSSAQVSVASGDKLDVRHFSVQQRMSALFQVTLVAYSENPNIDFDGVVGKEARFSVTPGAPAEAKVWKGVCNHFQQVGVETTGLSTYQISITPSLWFATQRRNHRMFQQLSEPEIVLQMLKEWGVVPVERIDKGAYKKRKYRVQYGESDFAFMCRMLEDVGISFYFEQDGDDTKLVLADAPQKNTPRAAALPFVANQDTGMFAAEHVSSVRVAQQVRPGKYTLRDHDYRLAATYPLLASAQGGEGIETKLERFHYTPGAFLFRADKGESTPSADDRGKSRTDEAEGAVIAQKRLDAKRGNARVCTFMTSAFDLAPGVVMSIEDHPRTDVGKPLLIVEASASGTLQDGWICHCEAREADQAYRPPIVTPKPKAVGVESATVVGPEGEEIHTDEFGRVRVHFHWDRENPMNEKASCWLHVSQPWGGTGYGGVSLPRVGQEVLVDFLGGDPDRPVITGRVYTNLQKVPYKLPGNKTQSGWRSNSTGGTGGYNELMFEDSNGKELVNIQAEKDMTELVKHDATHTVKNDRLTTIWKNDGHLVGVEHELVIAVPGDGPPSPGPTRVTMVHEKIVLTTGKASIIMDGANITFVAQGTITAVSDGHFAVASVNESVGIDAEQIVRIDGVEAVKINCSAPAPAKAELGQPSLGELFKAGVEGALMGAAMGAAPELGILFGAQMVGGALSDATSSD